MFEFTGKLKTLSIILIIIGAISVGASFLIGGGDHHADASHDGIHTEDVAEGMDEHGEMHSEEGAITKAETPAHSATGDPEDLGMDYHKSAPRANPEHNHYYQNVDKHVGAEAVHHQIENKPWANLLVNNFFFLAISLGALFFMAVQYAAQVGWSAVVLRVMEAMSSFLWVPMVIMLILIITGMMHVGGNHIWHWMAEGIMDPASEHYDEIIAGKEGYLNNPFFIIRTLVYFIGWVGAAMLLKKMSMRMEKGNDPAGTWKKMRNLSAGFLVFFAVTSSTSAWDWIMSIDTHWFSTLFGWYVFAGMFVSALTVLTLITIYLKNKGYLPEVNRSHIQDLGKFMFAFSIFWTYLWFSQFMLIWYSNIPEEVTYYMARFGEYKAVFFTMVALNFIFPILILMSRDSKRNFGFLLTAGIVMIIGHWLDVYILITPGTVGAQWSLGLVHLGTFLGFAGLFIFVVFSALAKRSLLPVNHPMLEESKHFHI